MAIFSAKRTFNHDIRHIAYMLPRYSILIVSLTFASQAGAQPPPAPVEFEVASVKPNKSNSTSSGINTSKGLWRATNITVKNLLINAFEILPEQVVSAPSWIDSDRFDMEGKFEEDPALSRTKNSDLHRQRLQALLKERFHLATHRETKEWQAYALVVAKKGAKLTPTERKDEGSSSRQNNGHWECKGVTMENFARNLAFRMARPVVDETALAGRFDFTLDFESDGPVRMGDKDNPISGVDTKGPSIFAALQDQLGLKLESRKAPVQLLVVDRIERPGEN